MNSALCVEAVVSSVETPPGVEAGFRKPGPDDAEVELSLLWGELVTFRVSMSELPRLDHCKKRGRFRKD